MNCFNNSTSAESVGYNPVTAAGISTWNQWHTYKMVWTRQQVIWYVDGTLVKSVTNTVSPYLPVPDEAMAPYFELWSPDSSFAAAYNSGWQPATSAAGNVVSFFDVDWARVYNTPSSSASLAIATSVAPSSVALASVSADAKNSALRLVFSGPLDTKEAINLEHYAVAINGKVAQVQSAAYEAGTNTVVLGLSNSFQVGDTLTVSVNALTDAQGLVLSDQLQAVKAA